ncbi:MAG TPA: FAD-dependent oxidoreductase, partial [Thermomicrobiales bacterium]|nr:FAD-dependent oxidoreductase [Thermomicrobiales bacterium]
MLIRAGIDQFAHTLHGRAIRPDDPSYDDARQVWNGMVDRRPTLVVQCAGAEDVAQSVALARHEGLEISVRGGGHGVAGNAVADGGLMIDLSQMDTVRVDPKTQTARVGAGATWGDFDGAAQEHGLATTGGTDSRTGVAGLVLGGGLGFLSRKYGLAADNLVAADIVTADGRTIRASEDEHPDLFWA